MAVSGKGARLKGMNYEREVVKFVGSRGIDVQRVRAGYHDDIGDVRGIQGWLIDCKNHGTLNLPGWLDHNQEKVFDSEGDLRQHCLVVKRRMAPVEKSYVVMNLDDFVATGIWGPF